MHRGPIQKIVRSYDDRIVRAYCQIRFGILRQRFLDEIGDRLPCQGRILDIGCGFGLFSLYLAAIEPGREIHGLDVDDRRIAVATRAAERLGLGNVRYECCDVRDLARLSGYDAAYMLDIVHHLPAAEVPEVLTRLRALLPDGGRLVVKDIDTRPAAKVWFTWVLDKLMTPRAPVHYWPTAELAALLEGVGFRVRHRRLPDILPYPHVLYTCDAVAPRP